MNAKEFDAALAQLGVNQSEAAELLGIGRRSILRYANGTHPVPPVVERLIRMLLWHRIPQEWRP